MSERGRQGERKSDRERRREKKGKRRRGKGKEGDVIVVENIACQN